MSQQVKTELSSLHERHSPEVPLGVPKTGQGDFRILAVLSKSHGIIPKKKTIFQLCLTLPININQATDLLASAGYTFVLSDKFEKTIKKIIEAKNTTKLTRIDVIDLILYELGLPVFNSAS